MRLGPFDMNAVASLDLIYSTNIEGERPSEAERDTEDFYIVPGIALQSSSEVGPSITLDLSAGYSHEKHFNREDLDVSLGSVRGAANLVLIPFDIMAGVYWKRDTEQIDEDIFVPADIPDTRRKVNTSAGYDFGLNGGFLGLVLYGVSHSYVEERFDDDDFASEESDEAGVGYFLELRVTRFVNLLYEFEETTTEYVNIPGSKNVEIDEAFTITISIDELFELIRRPKVTYGIGVQREEEDGESDGWELIHVLTVSDDIQFSPVLNLTYFASYTYEDNPEDDDIGLEYGMNLTHELSRRTTHSFTATRTPVETLGSTDETEETTFLYSLSMEDFVLEGIGFNFSVDYSISKPLNSEEEKIWMYSAGLLHSKAINPKLTRSIGYVYTSEDSNLEDELLEEHRVTLSFNYRF